jgi:heme-degrading monooxygenase HmoA
MITVANRIYVKPEYADAFEARFRERAGLVDKMPGFVSNQILRPVNEGDPYIVFTSPNVLELHEVIQDSTRPDLPPEPPGGPFKLH